MRKFMPVPGVSHVPKSPLKPIVAQRRQLCLHGLVRAPVPFGKKTQELIFHRARVRAEQQIAVVEAGKEIVRIAALQREIDAANLQELRRHQPEQVRAG